MKKKHIFLIPHLLCVFLVVAIVQLALSGYGNVFINYMALSATPLFFLFLLPFASSVSAVWLMIFVLKRKETACKRLYIASGVIGAAVCAFFIAVLFSTIFETDLAVFDYLGDIGALLLTFALTLVVIIWVLWLIILVKTKKPFGFKYRKENAEEADISASRKKRITVFTTAEKYMLLIPHIVWTLAVIAVTILTFVATGGDILDFITWLVFPLFVLMLFPIPTSISAIGMMIIALVKKRTVGRKKFIACGVLGCVILVLFALVSASNGIANALNLYIGVAQKIFNLSWTLALFCAFAIWIMWIIHAVKTIKARKCASE